MRTLIHFSRKTLLVRKYQNFSIYCRSSSPSFFLRHFCLVQHYWFSLTFKEIWYSKKCWVHVQLLSNSRREMLFYFVLVSFGPAEVLPWQVCKLLNVAWLYSKRLPTNPKCVHAWVCVSVCLLWLASRALNMLGKCSTS